CHDDQDDRLFYMLPEFPSISKGPDGGPMFSLLVFSRDFRLMKDATQALGPTETEGGLLTMQTELSVSDEDQAKIVSYLMSQHRGYRAVFVGPGRFRFAAFAPDPRPVKLSYPIWVDGKVQFLLIPSAGPTFVKATGGSEKPSLIAANLANYSALLGQEGENLFRNQIEKGETPGSVNYTISFMARIPSLTIDVTGNMSDVYKEIKEHCQVYEREGSRHYTYPQVSSLKELREKFASLHIEVKSVAWPSDADAKMVEDVENKLN